MKEHDLKRMREAKRYITITMPQKERVITQSSSWVLDFLNTSDALLVQGPLLDSFKGKQVDRLYYRTNLKGGKTLQTPFIPQGPIGVGSMTVVPPQRPGGIL